MPTKPGPILVTGANSGFGLGASLRFASRGWETWGTVRSPEKADVLFEAARKAGVGELVHPTVLDVSDHDAVIDMWDDLPPFYGVVNNAGYSEMGAIEDVTAAEAKRQLDVNLIAPAVVASCALPAMRKRGSGRIVMVSSMFGRVAIAPLQGWYHASKFGLEALSDVLRMEVAGFGVKVAIVEPGLFKTGIEESARSIASERIENVSSVYREAYRRSVGAADVFTRFAPPPDIVARTIVSAVESRRPLRRYVVGADAAIATATPLVPKVFTDAATRFLTGLSGPGSDNPAD
ncbi:MAG: SDR family NAD(P)-dependent oxidoreductase [Actinomycetia bacterium]|nr:SDR family NAD(P)-dependent oxidoreductase [Actinomycetes bacterium]MCP4959782.1 SDR family NAD(P)-dependent oxidoreductase [Actinomycetes bacterium]